MSYTLLNLTTKFIFLNHEFSKLILVLIYVKLSQNRLIFLTYGGFVYVQLVFKKLKTVLICIFNKKSMIV